jgi:hypothetical protein
VTEFKFVEVATVTDEELTRVVNDAVRAGWVFDGVHFAMRESSKRPAMAFVAFSRTTADSDETQPPKSR